MAKASRETASRVEDVGIMQGRYEELGGYTVGFEISATTSTRRP